MCVKQIRHEDLNEAIRKAKIESIKHRHESPHKSMWKKICELNTNYCGSDGGKYCLAATFREGHALSFSPGRVFLSKGEDKQS